MSTITKMLRAGMTEATAMHNIKTLLDSMILEDKIRAASRHWWLRRMP